MCDVDWNFVDSRFADIDNQITNANKRATEATDPVQKERALQRSRMAGAAGTDPQEQALHRLREMLAKQKNIDAV